MLVAMLVVVTDAKSARGGEDRVREEARPMKALRLPSIAGLPFALLAAAAVIAIAPAAATAKTLKFQGPLNQPYIPSPNGFATDVPTIELKVGFPGKKPTAVFTLKVRGITGPCGPSNGCKPVCVNNGVCEPPVCRTTADLDQFRVKKGRFAITRKDLVNGGDATFTVTGRVTKQGASGTVHVVDPRSASSSNPAYTCDTGVVSWTATKTAPSGQGGQQPIPAPDG